MDLKPASQLRLGIAAPYALNQAARLLDVRHKSAMMAALLDGGA
jgi:hypothetical protein